MYVVAAGASIVTVGAVASRLIVTDCEALPPALVASHVTVVPLVSLVIAVGSHPLVCSVAGDSASATVQVTVTSLRYQPFSPGVPVTPGAIAGGDRSSISVIEKERSRRGRRPFEAVTVKSKLPASVGVPERTPSALRVRPPGRLPAVTAKFAGGLPVPEVSAWL